MTALARLGRQELSGLLPMIERALSIEPAADLRLRAADGRLSAFVRLPFDVIAGCTLATTDTAEFDVTVSAAEVLRWCDDAADAADAAGAADAPDSTTEPQRTDAAASTIPTGLAGLSRRDAHWLTPLPPSSGWRRIDMVPAEAIHGLVRSAAQLAPGIDSRGGQQSFLSSTGLTVSSAELSAEVPLGMLSALVRMGFLPTGTQQAQPAEPAVAAVDVCRGWLRVAASYGSTYQRQGGSALDLLGGPLGGHLGQPG